MSADQINKWLTLSANVGVVIGLILLIVELKQNSELVRAQIHQARSDNYVAVVVEMADSEYLLPAWEKILDAEGSINPSALETLDSVDRARIRRYAQARMGGYDNMFYQFKHGYIDEEFYHSRIESSIKRMTPLWEELGLSGSMTPGFSAEVKRIKSDGS